MPGRSTGNDIVAVLLAIVLALTSIQAFAKNPVILGATTSTENSGLLAHVIKAFEQRYAIDVRAITAGSGAVLNMGARGDVDVLLVHAPADELRFMAEGQGIDRRSVMQNHFLIVGPEADPAGIRDLTLAADAFAAIARNQSLFLSRGDESGTHHAELHLWQSIGVDVRHPSASEWYRETGAGQGATLNIATNLGAYVLTDEATWLSFRNQDGLSILFRRDEPVLRNTYSVILVNLDRYPGINADDARLFADWLVSEEGQAAIASFRVDGRRLFHPVARLSG